MSKRFTPPTAEELAARGLTPDGTPIPKPAPKKAAKKDESE
jgi:hypothetical protein